MLEPDFKLLEIRQTHFDWKHSRSQKSCCVSQLVDILSPLCVNANAIKEVQWNPALRPPR